MIVELIYTTLKLDPTCRRSSTPSSKDTVSEISPNVTLQSQIWPEGKSSLSRERDLPLFSLPPRFPPPELQQHAFGENSNNSKRKSELRGWKFECKCLYT